MPLNPPKGRYRTIVVEPEAQSFIDQHLRRKNRFDEYLSGLEWLICRKPEIGTATDKNNPTRFLLYVAPAPKLGEGVEIWLLYSYDEQKVIIHSMRFNGGTR